MSCDIPISTCGSLEASDSRSPSRSDLPLEFLVHLCAHALDAINHGLPLRELIAHELDRSLEYQTLGSALALEPRNQLRQPVEAFANRLPSLLLCLLGM